MALYIYFHVLTPHKNGLAERKIRHITELSISMFVHASMSLSFWDEAFIIVVHVINCLPTPNLQQLSPYECLFHTSPKYSHLRVFGCTCFPNLWPYNNPKFQFKSVKCTFLVYSSSHKGYKCLAPNGRIYISRNVLFHEFSFPSTSNSSTFVSSTAHSHFMHNPPSIPFASLHSSTIIPTTSRVHFPSSSPSHSSFVTPIALQVPLVSSSDSVPQYRSSSSSNLYMLPPTIPQNPPSITNIHPMTTRRKQGIFKPHALTATVVPTSYKAALQDARWKPAMDEEYTTLIKNHTSDIVPLPQGKTPIGCKWVLRVKLNPNGSLNKYKARLVSKGFNQTPGFDFSDTFSPVVKPIIVRLILSIALSKGWSIRQQDINNAFLSGHLTEEVYMQQPEGFIVGNPTLVCKLKRSLYGLRQEPRAWFDKLTSTLCSLGFIRAPSDHSLFIKSSSSSTLYILVYVDDIIITGNNSSNIRSTIFMLHQNFALKDLGPLNYFLGIQVTPTSTRGFLLNQSKYISGCSS